MAVEDTSPQALISELEARLADLQRQTRTVRLVVLCLMAAVVPALIFLGVRALATDEPHAKTEAVPAILRAGRFEVVDEQGELRAFLGMGSRGVGLDVYDEKKVAAISLGRQHDTGTVSFGLGRSQDEQPRLLLIAADRMPAAVSVRDPAGKLRSVYGVLPDGSAQMFFCDGAGAPRATLAVGASGSPSVRVHAADGGAGASLSMGPSGEAAVSLEHAPDRPVARFGFLPGKAPSLVLMGPDGKTPAFEAP